MSNIKVLESLQFSTFDQVAEMPGHKMIHVFGVVHKLGPVGLVNLKNGM